MGGDIEKLHFAKNVSEGGKGRCIVVIAAVLGRDDGFKVGLWWGRWREAGSSIYFGVESVRLILL